MRRSEEARVSEEAVWRKGGEGGPRKLGMGYGEASSSDQGFFPFPVN